MRIGYDVTPLRTKTGVGRFAADLLRHLQVESPGDEIVPLTHRPPQPLDEEARNSEPWGGVEVRGWTRLPINRTIWMQTVLPWHLGRLDLDICHFTNSVAPLWAPCPIVLTIHDMSLWLLPECHYARRLLSRRPLIPIAARRAAAILTISESVKSDIVRILGLPAEKIHVTYGAVAPCFRPLERGPELAAVRRCLGLPERFLLAVGTIEPRKNLVRLLEAFAELRRGDCRYRDLMIVLAGPSGWKEGPVHEAVDRLGLGGAVRFLGHVPDSELVGLYNLATLLAFPSLYEGFGLPAVEAMACGTPVVTSRGGALEEVVGGAAELVKPTDVASIVAGLRRVLGDAGRREELRARGLERARRFTWSETARQTRALYERVLSAPPAP